jgi:hypothetical protein
MGLGKTLSMISAIVTLSEDAAKYESRDYQDGMAPIKSRATLIIVPSAGTLNSQLT